LKIFPSCYSVVKVLLAAGGLLALPARRLDHRASPPISRCAAHLDRPSA